MSVRIDVVPCERSRVRRCCVFCFYRARARDGANHARDCDCDGHDYLRHENGKIKVQPRGRQVTHVTQHEINTTAMYRIHTHTHMHALAGEKPKSCFKCAPNNTHTHTYHTHNIHELAFNLRPQVDAHHPVLVCAHFETNIYLMQIVTRLLCMHTRIYFCLIEIDRCLALGHKPPRERTARVNSAHAIPFGHTDGVQKKNRPAQRAFMHTQGGRCGVLAQTG